MEASAAGHLKVVRLLIESGAAVNLVDVDVHRSALHVSAFHGEYEVVKELLLAEGIQLNQGTIAGTPALHIAAQRGHVEVVRLLLQAEGLNVDHAMALLNIAAQQGDSAIVDMLLRAKGVDPNRANDDGFTALHIAAKLGHKDVLKLLLSTIPPAGIAAGTAIEKRVDVSLTPPRDGTSALFLAAQHGHVESVRLLLEAPGLLVNQATPGGFTPLYVAAEHGSEEIVGMLLRIADVNVNPR